MSTRFVCAVATAAALLLACDPYTPPDDLDGGVDAPNPDGPNPDGLNPDGPNPDGPDGPDTPPGTVALTVVRDGDATGTVTSNPGGIACGTTCAAVFDVGTVVTLTATPDANAEFIGWRGGGCSGTDPCVVTLAEATTVTATFGVPRFPITVALGGNGTGTVTATDLACPGTCSTTLPLGAQLTLTATPAAGAVFTGWSGACSGTAPCAITIAGATDVTANFALNQTLIVATAGNGTGAITSAPNGIDCGVDCDQTYPPATTVTLTAAAAADSSFTGWSGGGCSGAGTCVVTVNSSMQVTATFVRQQRALTVVRTGAGTGTVIAAPTGIDCGADCTAPYDVGTTVTLSASPSVGSRFQGWSGGGCSGTGPCVVTIAAAITVSASFAPIVHSLTVAKSGTGSGTITSSPAGIACGADCDEDYAQGTMVTLTATPGPDASFTGWSGGGCSGAGTCVVAMASATVVTATFVPVPYTLSVVRAGAGSGTVASSPSGINCGAACAASYDAGTMVTLTATPATGSTFTGWSGAGCAGTGTCVVAVGAAAAVAATFALAPYELTVAKSGTGGGAVTSSPGGIDCGADCAQTYDFGTSVTLAAMPAVGSTFAGWSGGGCSGAGTCVIAIGAATAVTATFTASRYPLAASKTGAGTGTIASSPAGIACGADCDESYDHGTVVTLTATPAAGSTFGGWTGGGCGGTGTCVVTLTAATSVSAAFTLAPFSLTVTRAGTGTGAITSAPGGIDCGSDCTEAYTSGTIVMLTAAPAASSTFTGWSGAGCSGTGACAVTISAAVTVTATFALRQYNLGVAKNGTGTGTVAAPSGINCGTDCNETLGHGASITLTATPAAGSTFTGWSGGGCSGTGACTVTITAATTVTATFAIIQYTLAVAKNGTGTGSVASTPSGISCGATCSRAYDHGASVTLTASPSTGSTFAGWSGGGCTGTGTCVVTVTASTTVTATFTAAPKTLTVVIATGTGTGAVTSSPSGINCGSNCDETYTHGTIVTLTATPAAGSTVWWTGACASAMANAACTVTMDQARTATVQFTVTYPTLTLTKAGLGQGTVMGPNFTCGPTCPSHSIGILYNTTANLTGSAAAGAVFTGWSGACTGTGACVVVMTQARNVTATFAPIVTGLTATPGPGKVTLAWTAVAGATRYHVFSGTTAGVYTRDWYTTNSTPSSIDAQSGSTWYYVVKAVLPSGETAASSEVSGRGWSNLSRGRTATQLTNYASTVGLAPLAVDGNYNGDFNQGSVTSTTWGTDQWWQVDLGASRNIKGVDLYNRTDCCSDALTAFLVFTSTDGISWTGRISHGGQAGSPSSFTLSSVTGRYLRVQLQAPAAALMLAEVDVWGY